MKKPNHILGQLPDYLAGSVSSADKLKIERHLRSCSSCKAEYATLTKLWSELGLLPEERPSERLRERFYAELGRHKTLREREALPEHPWLDRLNALLERLWPKQPAFQLAVALVCLLGGYVIGFRIDGEGGQSGNGDVAHLRAEVQNMQRLVMMSLLKTESASERIKGASWSERISRPDEEVLGALFETLNYDLNVNVRLAALEALAKLSDLPNVRQQLLSSLVKQTSPLIQLALVEVIAEVLDTEAIGTFRQLLKDPNLNKTVRERIEQRLKDLKS
jgi:hypothetical protein